MIVIHEKIGKFKFHALIETGAMTMLVYELSVVLSCYKGKVE